MILHMMYTCTDIILYASANPTSPLQHQTDGGFAVWMPGAFGGVMGSSLELLGTSFWDPVGVIFLPLGTILGAFGGHFGSLWGSFWGPWGSSLGSIWPWINHELVINQLLISHDAQVPEAQRPRGPMTPGRRVLIHTPSSSYSSFFLRRGDGGGRNH